MTGGVERLLRHREAWEMAGELPIVHAQRRWQILEREGGGAIGEEGGRRGEREMR